jgi:hypothetical protein
MASAKAQEHPSRMHFWDLQLHLNRTKDSQLVIVSVIRDPMLLSDVDAIDEGTIIQAAIAGKPEAFAELFHRYYPMIHAVAFRLCLNRATAQDFAQETFIKAARAIDCYRAFRITR